MFALDDLVETLAEIIYDNMSAEKVSDNGWKAWDDLDDEEQEVYLRTAEEIIDVIQDQAELFEE